MAPRASILRVSSPRLRLVAATVCAVMLATSAASAQRIWVGGGRFFRTPPKWAQPGDFDGSFLYCRGFYESVVREAGGQGWSTDYPGADNNFSVRLMELTRVHVKVDAARQPNYAVVRLTDPQLFHCPMLFMEDVGTAEFSDQEVKSLREFFLKGGVLWVDDYWGSDAWDRWVGQIGRVLPPAEFPIFDIPRTHPVMRTLYDVPFVPQVCSMLPTLKKRRNLDAWSTAGGAAPVTGWPAASSG